MEFLELAKSRYSVRSFKTTPVSDETINLILQAGQAAPTACNNQPQRIIVVKSEAGLEKLKNSTRCHFNAPLAMIVCYDKETCWKRPFDGKNSGDVDASIVTTHLMMEATEQGIGSTWVMFFDPAALRREFALPDSVEPVAILVMGYAADDCVPSPKHGEREAIEKLVCFE